MKKKGVVLELVDGNKCGMSATSFVILLYRKSSGSLLNTALKASNRHYRFLTTTVPDERTACTHDRDSILRNIQVPRIIQTASLYETKHS